MYARHDAIAATVAIDESDPETTTRQSRPYPEKTAELGGEGNTSANQAIAPEKVTSGVIGTSAFFLSCAGTTS